MNIFLKLLLIFTISPYSFCFASGLIELTSTDGTQFDNFRINKIENDEDGSAKDDLKFALNYTHNINGALMAGLSYSSDTEKTEGSTVSSVNTYGVHFFYNLAERVSNTSYVGFRFFKALYADDKSSSSKDGDTSSTTVIEFGHRYALGTLAGVEWLWTPKASYSMTTYITEPSNDDDVMSDSLEIIPINFNIIF